MSAKSIQYYHQSPEIEDSRAPLNKRRCPQTRMAVYIYIYIYGNQSLIKFIGDTLRRLSTAKADEASKALLLNSCIPASTKTFPALASMFPASTGSFPATTGMFPALTSTFPTSMSMFPALTRILPTLLRMFPASTGKHPTQTGMIHGEAGQPDTLMIINNL